VNKLFLLCLLFAAIRLTAQENVQYVAIKTGLNIREKPDAAAKVLDKIPYGTRLVLLENNEASKPIQTEGLQGMWRKVKYNDKTGYIVDSYLFAFPPPKAGTKTIKEYLAQISSPHGDKLDVKGNPSQDEEAGGYSMIKQLYKNGAETHEYSGYEYGSTTYFIPEFTVQQAFLLIRLIPEFADYIGEKDEFITKNKVIKKAGQEHTYTIEKEVFGNTTWIKKIKIGYEDGAIYEFELYQIDNQVVIFYGAGV
jgi:SH3 domain-containing protein